MAICGARGGFKTSNHTPQSTRSAGAIWCLGFHGVMLAVVVVMSHGGFQLVVMEVPNSWMVYFMENPIKMRLPPKRMVYLMEDPIKMEDDWGTPIGNLHLWDDVH